MTARYEPADRLFLWLLTDPSDPIPIGALNLLRTNQGVSVRYARSWVERGFALSEDLPLAEQEFLPEEKGTAAGAVDDARPDRWGERVIRFLDKPPRLSLMEFLYFAGDERFGALGVSTSAAEYVPRRAGPLPTVRDVETIRALVLKVLNDEPVPKEMRRLIAPGVTMGGAKPKALLQIDGEEWVVKFGAGEEVDTPLVEHAAMTLAATAGIRVAKTTSIPIADGHAVAIRRFDRAGKRRLHALSAHVALRAAAAPMGYPELAQLLRRRGTIARSAVGLPGQSLLARSARSSIAVADEQRHELFRRMVFNILIDNTDDHEKNHVLLVTDAQTYELSPAFDVLPSGQALGFQQMRVGTEQADSTIENALSECTAFGLSRKKAVAEARRVASAVDRWKEHFKSAGVRKTDLALLAEQIDRPFLAKQRRDFV